MAAWASVTWTHYSVLFEVTSGKTVRIRADTSASACSDELTLPPSPLPPLRTQSVVRADARKKKTKKKLLFIFLVVIASLERDTIYNFRFPVFNPQNPQTPRAPRAKRAKPREEEGFFSLVPLVTHPSSIPLLGGLTPKFLSLSLHSL
jgi:hypothetical protein